MVLVKILFNRIISTEEEEFMAVETNNSNLMTPPKRWEYIKLCLSDISQEIVIEYNLVQKATKYRSIYIEVRQGIHGLPQTGLLA